MLLPKLKIGFRAKLVIFLTIFLFAIVGSLLVYLDGYLSTYLKESSIDNFHIIAETAEGAYFAFAESLKIRAVDWSSDGRIRSGAEAVLRAKTAKEKEAAAKELDTYLRDEKMKYDPSVIIVDILDKDGMVVVSSRPERVGINEKEEEIEFGAHRFSEAIKSGFGEAFITAAISEPDEHMDAMIHAVTRIFSRNADKSGALAPLDAVLLVHFDKVSDLARVLSGEEQVRQGAKTGLALFNKYKSADIFLVNGSRRMVTKPRFAGGEDQKIETLPIAACFDDGREVAQDYTNHRGLHVFGASMCMKRDNLALVVEVSSDEVYGVIGRLQITLLVGGLIVFFLGSLGILFFVGRFFKKLMDITQVAEEVSMGNMRARCSFPSVSSADEIDNLAATVNSMLDNTEQTRGALERVNAEIRSKEMVLENKVEELERYKSLTVDRELRMMELKKELKGQGKSPPEAVNT